MQYLGAMTNAELIDAGIARAESAVSSRKLQDLLMAQAVLEGLLDHAAKQDAGDRAWVIAAAKSVSETLAEIRE